MNTAPDATDGLQPFFDTNNIPVVFSTDNNFIPFLYVALRSLAEHASAQNNYDINILHKGVTPSRQKQVLSLQRSNISIRFIDISERMARFREHWYIHDWGGAWHSDSVYFRFFIPEMFAAYDQLVFLDGDIIVCRDVAELFHIDLGEQWLGAVQDFARQLYNDGLIQYCEETLHVSPREYFNAGILLMNIRILREMPFLDMCMDTLKRLVTPKLQDQDVFNIIFNGHVKYLDYAWNCLFWSLLHGRKNAEGRCDPDLYRQFRESAENPAIFHYASKRKPWKEPHLECSDLFWQYARQTPFYEEIFYRNLKPGASLPLVRDAFHYSTLRRRYWRYKLICLLTSGKTKQRYKKKRDELKVRLRAVRRFLKNKG